MSRTKHKNASTMNGAMTDMSARNDRRQHYQEDWKECKLDQHPEAFS